MQKEHFGAKVLGDTMKKILNGLRYGNKKTKTYIIGVLLLLFMGTFSIWKLGATALPLWGMAAAFSYLLAFILIQSVSFQKSGEIANTKQEKQENKDINIKKHKNDKKDIKDKKDKKEIGKHDNTSESHALQWQDAEEKETEDELEEDYDPDLVLQQYDEAKLKTVFVKYKVHKVHYPIMIDSCTSHKIFQCPAYAWLEKGVLYLLLLEKEPRKLTISLAGVNEITYERGVLANPTRDYTSFTKPSLINMIFSTYLPHVYEESIAGKRSLRKNLYVIGQDLKVTNTAAATMFKMLSVNLSVRKQIRDMEFQNPYFEGAYALNVMLKDTVISVNEFKIKIKDILQKLADAKISNVEFMKYMNQLIQGRLITREYAQYYIEQRNKK